MNANDFEKVQVNTTQIINPNETVYLRTADADAINDCLVRVLNIKGLGGGLSRRIQQLKDKATRIKAFIKNEYSLELSKISTNAHQAVWQYGGATNICSTFYSLIGFSFSRRITPSNRINNELLFINLAAVTG